MTGGAPGERIAQWSTSDQAPQDAIDHWREIRRRVYVDVVCDPTTPRLRADVVRGEYETFALSSKRVSGDCARRGRAELGRGREDREDLFAVFQISGSGILQQSDRTAVVLPGSFVVYNSTLPFTMYHDGPYHQVIVHLDADNAYALAGLTRDSDLLAVTIECDGAMSAIAAFFINFAATQQHDPQGADYLATHASALASTLLAYAARSRRPDLPDFLQHDQIRTFIRTHLADPYLDADDIAIGAHLSRRSLYRLYEGSDTSVMQLVRTLRIDTAKQLLHRYPDRPISAIARETGFKTTSNFHRAFRSAAGITPGEYRERDRGTR
ncbi:helix-turn-helix domain-containing protein [Williamsia sterculiae]|uniref:AraC-type DNA-binding protein n=1 Tax=Williamsia sterculiae TaxID=1344003 RepID=A0A1N7G9D5_9NOCA|nr:helix-turn-helix domain-containing protein [Williamsia sterculiae]SIS09201.1 AraC-type DNA-binding protein [Williamsia sterculiae]